MSRTATKTTTVTDATVTFAWTSALEDARTASPDALASIAGTLLDRLGVRDLDADDFHRRLQPNASRSLTQKFKTCPDGLRQALAEELLLRFAQMQPPRTAQEDPAVASVLIWVLLLAGRAIDTLPLVPSSEEGVRLAAEMPLINALTDAGASNPLRSRVLTHPFCPPEVLEHACLAWTVEETRLASRHPRCPEEGKVMAALRL